jgi:hypothetical protein
MTRVIAIACAIALATPAMAQELKLTQKQVEDLEPMRQAVFQQCFDKGTYARRLTEERRKFWIETCKAEVVGWQIQQCWDVVRHNHRFCYEHSARSPLGCGNVRSAALPACESQALETTGMVRRDAPQPAPKPAPMADDSDECKAAFALPPSGARTMAVMRHCKVQPPR